MCKLGFGFWKENVALLELPSNKPRMMASAYRLPATVRRDMESHLGVQFADPGQKVLDYMLSEPVLRLPEGDRV